MSYPINVHVVFLTEFIQLFFFFQDDEGLPVPKRHGEFQLEIEEGNLFCTVAYNGDPDLRYVCIHANRATVFHNG